MGGFVIRVVLGLFWLVLVAGMVVVLQRKLRLLTRWPFGKEQAEGPGPDAATLDEEIRAARRRLDALQAPGGASEWLTGLLLWRQRRLLTDLCRRRQRLFAEQQRRQARAMGVRLPSATLPAWPFSIQALAGWRDGFRRRDS
jgi:hypothetical protein